MIALALGVKNQTVERGDHERLSGPKHVEGRVSEEFNGQGLEDWVARSCPATWG